jgi:adenylate cyclase class 2
MHIEIEAKLKVESLEDVRCKLVELGAEYLTEQLQRDYYFDDKHRSLTETDRCLRLRRQSSAGSEKFFLTYKGAKESDNFKKRQEIETEVDNAVVTERLLIELGYEKTLTFDKKRRLWRLEKCNVALDQLPLLGCFVEIEGPDAERIVDVQQSLELAHLPHIRQSYALLMEQKLNQLSREKKEIFLNGSDKKL